MTIDIPAFLAKVTFNEQGLVPAIAQSGETGEVLMMAWMNAESITKTLTTGDVYYWSRSRNELWRKGATSGHTQKLIDGYMDCDGDTILLKVQQLGAACHTGEKTCFFTKVI